MQESETVESIEYDNYIGNMINQYSSPKKKKSRITPLVIYCFIQKYY